MDKETMKQRLLQLMAEYEESIEAEEADAEAEEPAEEFQNQPLDNYACNLRTLMHSQLIPWHTSGFT